MTIPHILSGSTITVVVSMTPHAIAASHPNYERIKAIVADPDSTEDDVRGLLDIPKSISTYTDGKVYVKNGKLYLDGCEVRTSLGAKIMEFVRSGDDGLAEPLKLFLANVAQNPDPRAAADLFDWLQSAKLPITGDGYVLAWKAVTDTYRSIHAPGDVRFDHRIGKRVEQARDECDANPDRTCSQGLHFCAASYLSSYASGGNRIVVVKIHPKDVVAFPKDYNLAKGRACGYDVVGEVPLDKVKDFYPQSRPVYTGFDQVAPAAPVGIRPELGKVYRRRDGSVVVITRLDDDIVYDHKGLAYMASDGSRDEISKGGIERPFDLIKEIEFPLSKGDFVVGDRWVTRGGQTVTIQSISGGLLYCSHSTLYADNGCSYANRRRHGNSKADLVFNLDYSKPRVELIQQRDLKVGDKVRTRGGDVVVVTSAVEGSPDIVKTTSYVHSNTGICAWGKPGQPVPYANPQDVVEILERAPVGVGPRKLAVGQNWQLINGQQVTIRTISTTGDFPVLLSNGASVTLEGRYYSDGRTSTADLSHRV